MPRSIVTKTGFEYDRNWAIISRSKQEKKNNSAWYVENQWASHRRLASITTDIVREKDGGGIFLILAAPGVPTKLQVSIRSVPNSKRRIEVKDVQRTFLSGFAEDEGDKAAQWLTSYLAVGASHKSKREFRLAWCPPDTARSLSQDPRYGKLYAKEDTVAFADTAQFHVVSLSSLDALNRDIRNSSPSIDSAADPRSRAAANVNGVSMCRFRPNIGKRFTVSFVLGKFI